MFEIGSTLRDARVRRDISLQQAEADTKIRVKYIQAMENEDFDILPAGTYVKGFLRTYADYLGIDYQLVLDEYNERFGTGEHKEHIVVQTGKSEKSKTRAPRKNRRQTNYLFVAIFAIVIIAVLAYLGWGNSSGEQPTLVTTNGSETTTATVAAPVETVPEPAPTQTRTDLIESLVLSAEVEESWVRLRKDGEEGDILWEEVLAAGESKTFTFTPSELASNQLVLNLGNTIVVEVNGQSQRLNGGVYVITSASIAELP